MAEDKKREDAEQSNADVNEPTAAQTEPGTAASEAAEAPDAGEQPAGEAAEPTPEQQIEALKQELADTKDQALRTAAEAQNIRRRAEKDAEHARKFAIERFASDLLPIVDNLERALNAVNTEEAGNSGDTDDSVKAVLDGVELTYKSFLDTLEKHNLKAINPEGEPFDPQLHEAMSMVEAPDAEPNSVIQVVQKGYTLNDRLLRAAMVVVAKP